MSDLFQQHILKMKTCSVFIYFFLTKKKKATWQRDNVVLLCGRSEDGKVHQRADESMRMERGTGEHKAT